MIQLLSAVIIFITSLLASNAFASELPTSCRNQDMSRYMHTGNATDSAPDKIYKFDAIRTEVLAAIDRTNPDPCVFDFYQQAIAEEGEYWGEKLVRSGCTVSSAGVIGGDCPEEDEARRSVEYIGNLDRELRRRIDAKTDDAEIARDNAEIREAREAVEAAACAARNDPATRAPASTRDTFCCGSSDASRRRGADAEIGMIGTQFANLSYNSCIAKMRPSSQSRASLSGIGNCVLNALRGFFGSLWDMAKSIVTLPGSLWAARSQIWSLATDSAARARFARGLVDQLKHFFTDKLDAYGCFNEYEKMQYICRNIGTVASYFAGPQVVGVILGLGAKSAVAGARLLTTALSKSGGGSRFLGRLRSANAAAGRAVAATGRGLRTADRATGRVASRVAQTAQRAERARLFVGRPITAAAERLALRIENSRPFQGLLARAAQAETRLIQAEARAAASAGRVAGGDNSPSPSVANAVDSQPDAPTPARVAAANDSSPTPAPQNANAQTGRSANADGAPDRASPAPVAQADRTAAPAPVAQTNRPNAAPVAQVDRSTPAPIAARIENEVSGIVRQIARRDNTPSGPIRQIDNNSSSNSVLTPTRNTDLTPTRSPDLNNSNAPAQIANNVPAQTITRSNPTNNAVTNAGRTLDSNNTPVVATAAPSSANIPVAGNLRVTGSGGSAAPSGVNSGVGRTSMVDDIQIQNSPNVAPAATPMNLNTNASNNIGGNSRATTNGVNSNLGSNSNNSSGFAAAPANAGRASNNVNSAGTRSNGNTKVDANNSSGGSRAIATATDGDVPNTKNGAGAIARDTDAPNGKIDNDIAEIETLTANSAKINLPRGDKQRLEGLNLASTRGDFRVKDGIRYTEGSTSKKTNRVMSEARQTEIEINLRLASYSPENREKLLTHLENIPDSKAYVRDNHMAAVLNSEVDVASTIRRLQLSQKGDVGRRAALRQIDAEINARTAKLSESRNDSDVTIRDQIARERSALLFERTIIDFGDKIKVRNIYSSNAHNRYLRLEKGYEPHSLKKSFNADIEVVGDGIKVCRGSYASAGAYSGVAGGFFTICRSDNYLSREVNTEVLAAPVNKFLPISEQGVSRYTSFDVKPGTQLSLGRNGPVKYRKGSDHPIDGTGGTGGSVELFCSRSSNCPNINNVAESVRVPTCDQRNPACREIFKIQEESRRDVILRERNGGDYIKKRQERVDALIENMRDQHNAFADELAKPGANIIEIRGRYPELTSAMNLRRELELKRFRLQNNRFDKPDADTAELARLERSAGAGFDEFIDPRLPRISRDTKQVEVTTLSRTEVQRIESGFNEAIDRADPVFAIKNLDTEIARQEARLSAITDAAERRRIATNLNELAEKRSDAFLAFSRYQDSVNSKVGSLKTLSRADQNALRAKLQARIAEASTPNKNYLNTVLADDAKRYPQPTPVATRANTPSTPVVVARADTPNAPVVARAETPNSPVVPAATPTRAPPPSYKNEIEGLAERDNLTTRRVTEKTLENYATDLRITNSNMAAAIEYKPIATRLEMKKVIETVVPEGVRVDSERLRRMLSFEPQSGYLNGADFAEAKKFVNAIESRGGVKALDNLPLSAAERITLNRIMDRTPYYARQIDPDVKLLERVSLDPNAARAARTTASTSVAARTSLASDRISSPVIVKPNSSSIPASPARTFLTDNDLLPKYQYDVKGGKISVSDFMEDKGGRKFVVIKVDTPEGSKNVVYYRSNSSAVFRHLPSYHKSGWYDKSFSEEALTASPELQQILNSRLQNLNGKAPVRIDDMTKLDGVTRIYDNQYNTEYMNFYKKMESGYNERSITSNVARPLKDEVNRSFAEPKNVKIENPNHAPNYSQPVRSYTFENKTYGKVTAEVFPSRDGSVEFTIMRDEAGHAWISDIGERGSAIDSLGLRKNFINSKELTMPLWEYGQQIPRGYASNVRKGSYTLNWKYIREMPEIQRYYRERGLTMPGVE